MRRCVITGVTGLIGSSLVLELKPQWEIFGISRRTRENLFESEHVHHISLDLSTSWDIEVLPSSVEAVIHLAQSEYFRDFPGRAIHVFQVNTASTVRMLAYAREAGARRFILASSGSVYGHGGEAFTEEMAICPRDDLGFYARTKFCGEALAEEYKAFFTLITARFFFVYGPGQRDTMLIPRLIRAVGDGKPIPLDGKDGIRINPTYVTDAVVAVGRSLELEGSHTINVAGPEVLSLREMGETIGKVLGRRPNFQIRSERRPHHLIGNIRKMTDLLGGAKVGFEEGVRRCVESGASPVRN
jgi:nucleoside-diphosphate-sugar epimerase